MKNTYDVVIIGGGLNSLVAAAYLARGGKSVCLAEQDDQVGGAIACEEFAAGFRGSVAFGSAELLHPEIVRELKLAEHGLELLPARGGLFVPASSGESLHISGSSSDAVLKEISRHSASDAQAFPGFESFLKRINQALEPAFTKPLPDLMPAGPGDVLGLLNMGWRLRGLGKKDMPEAMRLIPMPVRDVLDERFESEILKAALAAPGLTASWLAPRSAGSALGLLMHRPHWTPGLLAPPVFVKGGMGRLADAVASAARTAGAEVRAGAEVQRILIGEDGDACGVEISSGDSSEEISARLVVSGVDPRRTLLELSDPGWLDPELATAARHIRARGTVAVIQLALSDLPSFTGAPDGDSHLAGRIQIGATLNELEQAFDGVKYGELPARPWLDVTIPTLTDPSLAPGNKHVMQIRAQFVPYDLAEGSWDERREELGNLVVSRLEEYAPGLAGKIEHRQVVTPLDLERRLGLSGGCLYHVELALDQMLFMRPMPGWYQHRTPINKLYLCGPGTHPGVATTGLSGKCSATQILQDWKQGKI